MLAEAGQEAARLPGKPVVLELTRPDLLFDCGRHLISLAQNARAIQSPFFVRCNRLLLAGIARKIHGRDLLTAPFVRWLRPTDPLPPNAIVMSDDHDVHDLNIRLFVGRDIVPGSDVMPYPMHPATTAHLWEPHLSTLRNTNRDIKLFFAGNQKDKYGSQKMRRDFGILSRIEVLDTSREYFADQVLTSLPTDQPASIVIADGRSNPITPDQWLPSLARANFFICCPGASQPMCHNLVEAMSVGTIPLIEYADRVTPALKDGVNAIVFRGAAGLMNALRRVEEMSTSEIDDMRRQVIGFYERHLNAASFMKSVCTRAITSPHPIDISLPFHDRNFFDNQAPQAAA